MTGNITCKDGNAMSTLSITRGAALGDQYGYCDPSPRDATVAVTIANKPQIIAPAIKSTPEVGHLMAETSVRAQRLRFILSDAVQAGEITQETAYAALKVWDCISGAVPGVLRVPLVDIMSGGRVLFTWNTHPHHLDIEIVPGQEVEFFYRNRQTNLTWEHYQAADEGISDEIIYKMNCHRILF